jgi:hypothetical protein
MSGNRGEPPDDRHFAHYLEMHASNSVDEAVARAERWAKALLARRTTRQGPAYPEAAWFADQIVAELHFVRHYLGYSSPREARKAVWYALRLGEVIAEARLMGYLDSPDNGPKGGPENRPPPGPIPPAPEDVGSGPGPSPR